MRSGATWTWVFLAVALLLALAGLCAGSVPISMNELWAAARGEGSPTVRTILWQVRLPEVLTAALAGCGLAASGLLMQTLFRNPLAGPSVLGVSSGASLGVALVLLAAPVWSAIHLPRELMAVLAALGGALGVLLLIATLDRRVGGGTALLILGLMVGYLCSAVVSVLQSMSTAAALKGFVLWGMGSFAGLDLLRVGWMAPPVVLGLAAAAWSVKPLNSLLLGDAYARSLGVDVMQVRRLVIWTTGLLAGTITAFCGPIAFLGLATPHVARAFVRTADHRALLPASVALGMALALLCDLLVRLAGTEHALPLNAVTSLLGAPVVLWVMLRGHRWNTEA